MLSRSASSVHSQSQAQAQTSSFTSSFTSSLPSSLSSSDSGGSSSSSGSEEVDMKRRKSSPDMNDSKNDSKIKMIENAIDRKYDHVIERDASYCLYFNNRYNKWTIEKKSSPVMVVTYDSKAEAVDAYKKFILSAPEVN